ncbi:MAG: arsenate reductase (glutaredoxin) [Flavobacteriaceae bacterium]
MKIYHNPRCRKSREGVQYLMDKGVEFEIIEYLKDYLSKETIQILLNKLNISALELVRKNEKIWKENYKDKNLSEKDLIEILHREPKLIERPIIEVENLAVIARPKENINKLI